jgi:hypothetical protein
MLVLWPILAMVLLSLKTFFNDRKVVRCMRGAKIMLSGLIICLLYGILDLLVHNAHDRFSILLWLGFPAVGIGMFDYSINMFIYLFFDD